jgi:hypothetical protein
MRHDKRTIVSPPKEKLIRLDDLPTTKKVTCGPPLFGATDTTQKNYNTVTRGNMTDQKKDKKRDKSNVRDLKPKKDAKGGMRVFDGTTRQNQSATRNQ